MTGALEENTHPFTDGGNGLCTAMIQLPWQAAAVCLAPPGFRLHQTPAVVRSRLTRVGG